MKKGMHTPGRDLPLEPKNTFKVATQPVEVDRSKAKVMPKPKDDRTVYTK